MLLGYLISYKLMVMVNKYNQNDLQSSKLQILTEANLCNLRFNSIIIYTAICLMRSLYVDDIPGAKPKRHVYTKNVYREKHDQEIFRFAKNPEEKRFIDWYVPPKRLIDPLERDNDDSWRTKRTLRKSMDIPRNQLSKSVVLTKQAFFKQHQNQQSLSKSSILQSSARSSLGESKRQENNPYFPHMYVDPKMGQSNKWSGSKFWQHEPTKVIKLPLIEDCYFKKWD